ncbi:hypothetical protein HHI36_017008 [Cryptolaemus montrouzieri]|uniref:Uncharacterized protein n=1 Tax=Cryptolaemus montrouzieri TaxID=559131 RepID=A0ABD2NLE5_9CUCU
MTGYNSATHFKQLKEAIQNSEKNVIDLIDNKIVLVPSKSQDSEENQRKNVGTLEKSKSKNNNTAPPKQNRLLSNGPHEESVGPIYPKHQLVEEAEGGRQQQIPELKGSDINNLNGTDFEVGRKIFISSSKEVNCGKISIRVVWVSFEYENLS